MPKTFPISLLVEDIALGTVLRKLHRMPGIVRLDFNMGHGGNGAGRKWLEEASKAQHKAAVKNAAQRAKYKRKRRVAMPHGPMVMTTLNLLANGPETRAGIAEPLLAAGMNAKGVGNLLYRLTNVSHLIKQTSNGYAITSKGKAVREQQHG